MWQSLNALFLINVFENVINSCSNMDTADIHAPTKQIRDFFLLWRQ
jgi:hypothetical protein